MAAVSRLLADVVPHRLANMVVWDERAGELRRHVMFEPVSTEALRAFQARYGQAVPAGWPAAQVFEAGRTIRFSLKDIRLPEIVELVTALGLQSGCGVVLETPRQRLGVLLVASEDADAFSADAVRLLERAAYQLALVIENVLQFEQVERYRQEAAARRDRLQLLLELANAVTSERDLPALMATISRLLREKVTHHFVSLTLWDPDARALRRHALVFESGRGVLKQGNLVSPDAPSAEVFRTRRTRAFRWADVEAIGGRAQEVMTLEGLHSVCCVPLQTPRGCHGTLNIARPADEDFPEDEIRLLEQIAQQLAIAIENALQFEAAERFRREAAAGRDRLELLLEVNNAVVGHLDSHAFRMSMLAALKRAVPHDYASLSILDPASGDLRLEAYTFYDERGVVEPRAVVALDRTPAGLAFRDRRPRLFDTAALEQLDLAAMPHARAAGFQAACSVPLVTARGASGAMTLARYAEPGFGPGDVALLAEIARQIALALDNTVAYSEIAALKDRLAEEKVYLEDQLGEQSDATGITGSSPAVRAVLHKIRTVAPTDATVLLLGETGTGKELVARAIHDSSRRQQQTFVRVNAAALPATLVESELFGYDKGAFTGATTAKLGRIELANHGTLFLDEVGDMPLDLQPKLLRALQEQEFERLGSTRTQRVDVRLIAATNRNLEEMVEAGTFRRDLYYRLSVIPIHLPPLRGRREDIPALVWHFVRKFSREMGREITSIPTGSMERLLSWPWPGNIRELQNVIERAVILSTGHVLEIDPAALQAASTSPPSLSAPAPGRTLESGERELILQALRESRGVIAGPGGAAARLGVKRTTLNSKMRKLGIVRPSF